MIDFCIIRLPMFTKHIIKNRFEKMFNIFYILNIFKCLILVVLIIIDILNVMINIKSINISLRRIYNK